MVNYFLNQFLNDAIKAVKEAGKIIERAFLMEISYEEKEKGEIVTPIDKEVEQFIYESLNHYSFSFEGEELGFIEGEDNEFKIILDPIDGTTNFYYKIGFFNIALALERNKEVVLGIVYNPLTKELYHAIKGEGAYLNFNPIKAKPFNELKKSIFGFCYGNEERDLEIITNIYPKVRKELKEFRRFGSANLEIVYSINKFHGFVGVGLKPYDFKAAVLIAKEAGLVFKDSVFSQKNDIIVYRKGLEKIEDLLKL
ncbi:MAG: inositol monophosphatase family protein [Nanoarchaeota archaeon]